MFSETSEVVGRTNLSYLLDFFVRANGPSKGFSRVFIFYETAENWLMNGGRFSAEFGGRYFHHLHRSSRTAYFFVLLEGKGKEYLHAER